MKFRNQAVATLIWVLSVMTGVAMAQEIPESVKVLHKLLTTDCGYEYFKTGPANVLTYTKWKSIVTVGLDNKGVRSGTVLFMPGCDVEKAATALSSIYFVLQIRIGKGLPSKENAYLKGRRLMDAVTHNLTLMDKTTFPFDDLMVIAEKYSKDNSFSVRLMPW
jgi:hypothetical protein